MEIYTTKADTAAAVEKLRKEGKTIGFVPTMGALHRGHLSLMEKAKAENDILAVSVFVNPIQFNNKADLEKYPRNLDKDIKLLEEVGCDILFSPTSQEMYPEGEAIEKYDFGELERVMEGKYRPGHFNGVAVVVKRLFDIVSPHKAYFGEKDFQQLAIIKELVKTEKLPVEIVPCATVREAGGLAMSSRNERLTPQQRKEASFIYETLQLAKKRKDDICPLPLKQMIYNIFDANENFKLEYFEIADEDTLKPVTAWGQTKKPRAFVAVWMNDVRLIDNISLI
jgi:pantoate--beta-alanine ligase